MADFEYEIDLRLNLPSAEVRKMGQQINSTMGGMTSRLAGATAMKGMGPGGIKGPAGMGVGGISEGMDGISSMMGGMSGMVKKFLPMLGALMGIYAIVNNQFSGLKDVISILTTIFQLFLKPVSDMLMMMLLPFIPLLIKMLPYWNQVMAVVSDFVLGVANEVGKYIMDQMPGMIALVKNLWTVLSPFIPIVGLFIAGIWPIIKKAGEVLITFFENPVEGLKMYFGEFVPMVAEFLAVIGVEIMKAITPLLLKLGTEIFKIFKGVVVGIFTHAIALFPQFLLTIGHLWGESAIYMGRQFVSIVGEGMSQIIDSILGGLGGGGNITDFGAFTRRFQFGGVVPGPVGKPVHIIAHGGERYIPAGGDVNSVSQVNNFYGISTGEALEEIQTGLERGRRLSA